jgi:hypothetical protein
MGGGGELPDGGVVENTHASAPVVWSTAYRRPSMLPARTNAAAAPLPVTGGALKPCLLGATNDHTSVPAAERAYRVASMEATKRRGAELGPRAGVCGMPRVVKFQRCVWLDTSTA